jgi:hypothetical protein
MSIRMISSIIGTSILSDASFYWILNGSSMISLLLSMPWRMIRARIFAHQSYHQQLPDAAAVLVLRCRSADLNVVFGAAKVATRCHLRPKLLPGV